MMLVPPRKLLSTFNSRLTFFFLIGFRTLMTMSSSEL